MEEAAEKARRSFIEEQAKLKESMRLTVESLKDDYEKRMNNIEKK